jgi:HNH endonuclease/AP2 domain
MPSSRKIRLTLCICGDEECTIPFGICHCGCLEKTDIATSTIRRYGAVKGLPKRFRLYHHVRSFRERWPTETDPLVRHLPLGNGKYALVDTTELLRLSAFIYHAHREKRDMWYAARGIEVEVDGKTTRTFVRLHWDIIGKPPPGFVVDHINGDGLDNRRCNLRFCSVQENSHNHNLHKRNISGHSGVWFNKKRQLWEATIGVNGKKIHLGRFSKHQKQRAIDCRLAAEKKYYGEFAPKRS